MAGILFRRLRGYVVVGAAVASLGVVPCRADDEHDHDRARRAVEAGEVLPLDKIMEGIERDYPGQIMEVELEQKRDRWVYEIKVLQTGGILVKLKIDGRTGNVIGPRERHQK